MVNLTSEQEKLKRAIEESLVLARQADADYGTLKSCIYCGQPGERK